LRVTEDAAATYVDIFQGSQRWLTYAQPQRKNIGAVLQMNKMAKKDC
jgi:hypothetical protein